MFKQYFNSAKNIPQNVIGSMFFALNFMINYQNNWKDFKGRCKSFTASLCSRVFVSCLLVLIIITQL